MQALIQHGKNDAGRNGRREPVAKYKTNCAELLQYAQPQLRHCFGPFCARAHVRAGRFEIRRDFL
jgi:hypothetical protein